MNSLLSCPRINDSYEVNVLNQEGFSIVRAHTSPGIIPSNVLHVFGISDNLVDGSTTRVPPRNDVWVHLGGV